MCDHCDGGREWCIIMIPTEEFIGLVDRVITSLGRGCDGVVKKEHNFWCKLDIEGFGWSGDDI